MVVGVVCRSKPRTLMAGMRTVRAMRASRTGRTFDRFWLGRTLAITQRDEQCSDMFAVAGWTTPCLTRALRYDDAFIVERRAHFDRLITADQNATGCRRSIGVQIAHSVPACVNTSP